MTLPWNAPLRVNLDVSVGGGHHQDDLLRVVRGEHHGEGQLRVPRAVHRDDGGGPVDQHVPEGAVPAVRGGLERARGAVDGQQGAVLGGPVVQEPELDSQPRPGGVHGKLRVVVGHRGPAHPGVLDGVRGGPQAGVLVAEEVDGEPGVDRGVQPVAVDAGGLVGGRVVERDQPVRVQQRVLQGGTLGGGGVLLVARQVRSRGCPRGSPLASRRTWTPRSRWRRRRWR